MKNLSNVLYSALAAVLIVFGACLILDGCSGGKLRAIFSEEEEKTETATSAVEAIVNPDMSSVKEVVDLQSTLLSNAHIDSVFMSIPELTLIDVATVTLKNTSTVNKKSIVDAYLANRNIYDNLPPNDAKPDAKPIEKPLTKIELVDESSTKVTEAPPTRVEENGSYKDTVIDGRKALIKQ